MDACCRIELLGGLCVRQGERVITRFRTQKTATLLAYLAYHLSQSHPRELLIEMLWPEVEPAVGRPRLSLALSSLRRPLEPPGIPAGAVLVADRRAVRLNPLAVTTDVADFEAALQKAATAQTNAERAQRLAEAVALYRGELLPGFYDQWVQTEQPRLLERFLQAIRQLVAYCVKADDLESALDYAHRAVSADPLQEESHYDLMRLYVAADRPVDALRQYRELERVLREELGMEPSAETRELAETLYREVGSEALGDRRPKRQPSAKPSVRLPDVAAQPPARERTPRLPLQFTRFFGREEEIGRLVEMLTPVSGSRCPLVTLSGTGGSGKTRLAIEVAGRISDAFAGGVWFVPLADLSDSRLIPGAILDALRLPRSPNLEPLEQVADYLGGLSAPALLILDNLEHLLLDERRKSEDGAAAVKTLLERCPALTCLVTSRQLLGLEGEREFSVMPLPVPVDGHRLRVDERETPSPPFSALNQIASVQLFVDRAQSIRPDFQLTGRNARAVAALCERLEGIPLAIELAAARSQVLTPAQMLAQLERRFEFLVSRRRDAIERHRTLHAATEWSYRLLSPALQRFFCRLSVFRGGWTVEAAEAVCEEPQALDYLAQLQECSLVLSEERDGEMRFRMLETLREFGQERLAKEERANVEGQHRGFFRDLTEAAETQLCGMDQVRWLERLEQEHNNLRAALERQEENTDPIALRIAGALAHFWEVRGYVSEGRSHLLRALAPYKAESGAHENRAEIAKAVSGACQLLGLEGNYPSALQMNAQAQALYADMADEQGIACSRADQANIARLQGEFQWARALSEQALLLARKVGDRHAIAHALWNLGHVAYETEDFRTARSSFEEALSLQRVQGHLRSIAALLATLGSLACDLGDLTLSRELLEQALERRRDLGDLAGICHSLGNLARVAYMEGDDATARTQWEEALPLCRKLGDKRHLGFIFHNLGNIADVLGEFDAAWELNQEALAVRRELGNRQHIADSVRNLGSVARERGDLDTAQRLLEETLSMRLEQGERKAIAIALESMADLAVAQQRFERAVRLCGAAGTLREGIVEPPGHLGGTGTPRTERARHEARVAQARAVLGEEAFAAVQAEGHAMTLEQAVAYALQQDT